jgi:hypothetical protein
LRAASAALSSTVAQSWSNRMRAARAAAAVSSRSWRSRRLLPWSMTTAARIAPTDMIAWAQAAALSP